MKRRDRKEINEDVEKKIKNFLKMVEEEQKKEKRKKWGGGTRTVKIRKEKLEKS